NSRPPSSSPPRADAANAAPAAEVGNRTVFVAGWASGPSPRRKGEPSPRRRSPEFGRHAADAWEWIMTPTQSTQVPPVLVVDFAAQYALLIARAIREAR